MIFKNAFLNLIRSKSRNSLILLIMIVISLTATIALVIQSSSQALVDSTLSGLRVEATVIVDREKIFASLGELTQQERNAYLRSIPALQSDDFMKYATASTIESSVITVSTSVSGESIVPVDISETSTLPSRGINGEFRLIGYESAASMQDFLNGNATLVEGVMFDMSEANYDVIIHQSLALLNDLSIYDSIILVNPRNPEEKIEFFVSGIYSTLVTDEDASSPLNDSSNHLLISKATLDSITSKSIDLNPETISNNGILMSQALTTTTSATYYLSSIDDFEAFKSEIELLGLDTTLYSVISPNLQSFEQSVQPIIQISKTSMSFLILTLVVGLGLLILFQFFITKQRQYDIGVYAAIGMKKSKIALLFITESMVLTSLAIAIGVSIGMLLTPIVSNELLGDAIIQAQTQQNTVNQNFNRPGQELNTSLPSSVNYINELNVSLDLNTIVSLLGLGLLITMLSSSIGVFSVSRFEPLQILSER
jgi:putative ABC transport system permease protein